MHFKDLDLCRYSDGPTNAENWSVPLLAVGWLEHPISFPRGTPPAGLPDKLRELAEQALPVYWYYCFLGPHTCSLCGAAGKNTRPLPYSPTNLFIPGVDLVYVAPGGVSHYLVFHQYLPPLEFCEAALQCPSYETPAFQDALRKANRGNTPPLLPMAPDGVIRLSKV